MRKLLHSDAYNRLLANCTISLRKVWCTNISNFFVLSLKRYLDALEREQNFPPSSVSRKTSFDLKPEEWLASSTFKNKSDYIAILQTLEKNLLQDAVRLSKLV